MEDTIQDIDIATALGAERTSSQCFSIYIPNKDKDGREFGNQRMWVLEAIELLSSIGGGATAMPPVEGTWRNDLNELVWEHPVVVYSYVKFADVITALPRIREFLHRLGRTTNQGEVAAEFDNFFYRIRQFDLGGS